MLVNWKIAYSKDDIPDEQASNKVIEGTRYWFFKHWDEEGLTVDVVDFTRIPVIHKMESRFLKFYVSQTLKVLPDIDGYDLLISHSAQSGLLLAFMRSLAGKRNPPHIIIDPGSFNGGRARLAELFPIRMCLPSVTGVIGHAESQVPYYRKTLSLAPDRIRIAHVGVDTDFYSPREDSATEDYVVCIGYLKRDWATLLKAWSSIVHGPQLLIVGREGLGDRVAGVNSVPYVPRSRLREIVRKARFVVVPLPYYSYSFGQISLLLSQALGKAVIVTKVPGLLDYVDDGRTALFVNPYDAEDMRKKITLLLSNPEMAGEMGREARKVVVSKFSEKEMGLEIKKAVDELCRN
jgi:glycosyltransferase involved in cell wall biosynthesis